MPPPFQMQMLPKPCPRLYAIQYRNTLYGIHAPNKSAPGITNTFLLTFTDRQKAEHEADILSYNKNLRGKWPSRIVSDGRPQSLILPRRAGCHIWEPCLAIVAYKRHTLFRQCSMNGLSIRIIGDESCEDLHADRELKPSLTDRKRQLRRLYRRS